MTLQEQVNMLTRRVESLERWIAQHLDAHVQEVGRTNVNPWHYVVSQERKAIGKDVPLVLGNNHHCHNEETQKDKKQ